MMKGDTRFFSKEEAKRLVAGGRFIYTAVERGHSQIRCPFCKEEFELTDKVRVEEDKSVQSKEDNKQNEQPQEEHGEDLVKKHVCPFCLEYEGKSEHALKIHLSKCPSNTVKDKSNKKTTEKVGEIANTGSISTGDVENPDRKKAVK